jgi:heme/copper-type cytochrome/quinol oxidase subunit 2
MKIKLMVTISVMLVLFSANYVFGQIDETGDSDVLEQVFDEHPILRILYILLLVGIIIGISFPTVIYNRIKKKNKQNKLHGTFLADGKKITGTLPKGYSGKEIASTNDGVLKFRMLQLSLVLLCSFIAFTGVFVGLFLGGATTSQEENIDTWNVLVVFSLATWIVGIPLLVVAIRKYRKSELTSPTEFTKMYYRGRAKKQCTICKEHPVSQKYHMKNKHHVTDVDIKNYFVDCGCDICANYDNSEFREGIDSFRGK